MRTLHATLLDQILSVLRRNGHVLLPADTCGRVLELLLLLDTHWTKQRLASSYKLVWVGHMASNVLTYVQSQLEWLSTTLGRQFDSQRGHPLVLSSVDVCTSVAQVKELEREGLPMVVVASGGSLDCGPARDLLVEWGEDAENAIVFTDAQVCTLRGSNVSVVQERRGGEGGRSGGEATALVGEAMGAELPSVANPNAVSHLSSAAQLLDKWCDAKLAGAEMEDEITVDVLVPTRSPLEGKELAEFNAREEQERRKRAAEEERIALLKEVELARGRLRLGEEDLAREQANVESTSASRIEEDEMEEKGAANSGQATTTTSSRTKSRFDSNLFLKFSKPLFMTFSDQEEAVGIGQDPSVAKFGIGESIGYSDSVMVDDYGIATISEKFHDLVTGSDPSKYSLQAGGTGRVGDDALWMKRGGGRLTSSSGYGGQDKPSLPAQRSANVIGGDGKNVNPATGAAEDDAADEVALEIADLSEGQGIIRGHNGRPPTKVYTVPRQLEVLAEVSYIPLEGRVTSRAARQTVRALQPRQVVILGGGSPPHRPGYRSNHIAVDDVAVITDDEGNNNIPTRQRNTWVGEARALAEAVRDVTVPDQESIFIPDNGEALELSVGHAAYSVRLIDTPYGGDEMDVDDDWDDGLQQVENSLFGADEVKVGQYTVRFVNCVATGQKVAADGSAVLAPRRVKHTASAVDENSPHILLSDGEVLLTDLRLEMIAQGLKAEYSTHAGYQQLIVNGRVAVMKDQATGRIHVEGPLCQDYFTVRSIVCSQYTTL